MYKRQRKNSGKEQEGFATIELAAFLILFVAITSFLFGFWGILHSATLNSIGARAYAYETFRHRTHLQYFRIDVPRDRITHFYNRGFRFHAIIDGEEREGISNVFHAPYQYISLNLGIVSEDLQEPDSAYHNETLYQDIQTRIRYSKQGVNPVWSKVAYGICLHSGCGD